MTSPAQASGHQELAGRIVALAAHTAHRRIPGSLGVEVLVRRAGHVVPELSAVTDGVRTVGSPGPEGSASAAAAGAVSAAVGPGDPVGIAGAVRVAVAPLPAVDAVITVWLSAQAPHDDAVLGAVADAAPLVEEAVRLAEEMVGLVVVPSTRLVIEQAKGVLMGRHGLGPEEAFAALRRLSQSRNVPVRDLARAVVAAPTDLPAPA